LLRRHRLAAGLTQEQLADRAEMSARAISNLERGVATRPLRHSVQQLMAALGLEAPAAEEFAAVAAARSGLGGQRYGGRGAPGAEEPGRGWLVPRELPVPVPAPGSGVGRAASDRVVPRFLPAAVPGFVGRRDQLATLTQVLLHHPSRTTVITVIGGPAGVGKTALAVQWAHKVAGEFPDGQLFVNLRGFDPSGAALRPDDAVRVLLDALGIRADRLPQTEEAQFGLYRSLLADKRMLVVLDNVRDVAQVRPLLPGSPTCRVVVTSRSQLTGLATIEAARPLMLDVLTDTEAHELLQQRLGSARLAADPDAAAQIIDSCARLPLALCVIAAHAAMRPNLALARVAANLAGSPSLDAFADGDDPAADIRAAFSSSCRQLDPGAARFFRLAGLHPGPNLDRYAVAALAATTADQADCMLEVLTRACLIQRAEPVRYAMHDLLRGYARELMDTQDGQKEGRAALTRLFDYYLHATAVAMDTVFPAERTRRPPDPPLPTPLSVPAFAGEAAPLAWLDAERVNLVAVAVHAAEHGWPGHATLLATTLYRYLDIGGHYPDAITVHGQARQAARRTGDRPAEANALKNLGAVGMRQRRYQEAARYYEQSLDLYRDICDPAGQARAVADLGFVEFLQGRCEVALGHLRQALILDRETGDRKGEAHVLASLGFVELRQGRYQQAADYLRQSRRLFRDTRDRTGEAHALGNLGEVELRQGRYQDAADYLHQALALCRETGDRSNAADVLAILGMTGLRQGRYQDAADYLHQALALCGETGDLSTKATVLNGLGEVLLATGRNADARGRHADALDAATRVGEKYEQARAHDGLAGACQAAGNLRQARRHWREALTLYTALGAPEAEQVRARLAPGRLARPESTA
jgi:tetratricopeptide (TPR) repeat protein/transcriptional regulator with XRE-family HTH domain